jgi:hypothetical protein
MEGTYLRLLLTAGRKRLRHVTARITNPLTLYRSIGNHGLTPVLNIGLQTAYCLFQKYTVDKK